MIVSPPFALPIADKAGPLPGKGFADAVQKPPALDLGAEPPSESEMRAKGYSEGRRGIERVN